MNPVRVLRRELADRSRAEAVAELAGLVTVRDHRTGSGERVRKGTHLDAEDAGRLLDAEWEELHLLRPGETDVHERDAGERLARAVAGDGVEVGGFAGGAWPLRARHRGLLEVRADALEAVNRREELSVHTHLSGRNVDRGEVVARVKVIPFLVDGERLAAAESEAGEPGGVVRVRPYRATVVGAVVQETLGKEEAERFEASLREKLAWFDSDLLQPRFVRPDAAAVAGALDDALAEEVGMVLVAGARAMDPLDPAFEALERVGATVVRHGLPAHPGSLLWVGRRGEVPVIGVPTCGLFSRTTVFDLVLARALAGLPLDADALAGLGHGGLLTPDMSWRLPPYRSPGRRGESE